MKLNKIFTLATLAVSALFATSCSDDVPEYAGPGQWDANANYANVYFASTSKTEMVDPAEDPVTTVELYRHNTSNAVTVPVKVLENTNDAFTVSNAEFAAGDSVATIKIDYSKAEIGTAHKLVLTVEGADYVSSYSQDIAYTYTVTRVKWNSLGTGILRDDFWFEDSWEVEILQRDDDNSYYRVVDPFGGAAKYGLDGSQSEYVELHVLNKGDLIRDVAVNETGTVDWYRISTGYVHSSYGEVIWCLHPQNFTSLADADLYGNSKVNAYLEDGKTPGQIQLAPYWYMFGVGGWNQTTTPTIFINFPGFVEEYTATIDDFAWEPVYSGEFTSEQLGTKKDGVTLYKGVPVDSIETANPGCYERFEAANGGTPYIIESPYANGKDLVFLVKNKNISTLSGYELQETGLTALNQKVYANILASSQFTDSEVSLDITFQNEKGDVEYGTTTEVLANITWSKVGTGTFTYTMWWDGGQDEEGNYLPLVDPGYEVLVRDDNPSMYKVPNWGGGVDYVFTWDKNTNVCATQLGAIGDTHPSYGTVYVVDASTYSSRYPYEENPSQYVPEENTFYFFNAYVVSAGSFGVGLETLTVEWDAAAARSKAATTHKAKAKSNKKLKLQAAQPLFKWNVKHVQASSRLEKKHGAPQNAGMLFAE